MLVIALSIFILSSCVSETNKSELKFIDIKQDKLDKEKQKKIDKKEEIRRKKEEALRIKNLKKAKILSSQNIIVNAKKSFSSIENILKKKCYDCHNSNRKLPYYGRIFKKHNPVYKHKLHGLQALDFTQKYPLKAHGDPSQVSLLLAFKDSVLDRTMPIKSYTRFYRKRKLSDGDDIRLLTWINRVLENIEIHNENFKELDQEDTPTSKVVKIFEEKCYRCHANGASFGGFGDMQNLDNLLKNSRYINLEKPEESLLFTLSENGQMPPNIRSRLNDQELNAVLEWITANSSQDI